MTGIASVRRASIAEMSFLDSRAAVKPMDFWWAAAALTLVPVGLIWDFSWESSIGVDRFWSPPHVATYLGVWLGGLLGLRHLFVFTLAHDRKLASGVSVGKLRAPSGSWVLLWGASILQTALLLDNWWQRAYGLGAGLWHPPQILKAVGFFALLLGGAMLCAAAQSDGMRPMPLATKFLIWHGGLLLAMSTLVLMMANHPNFQHKASFHLISCAVYPALLLMVGRASQLRWGATWVALVYMTVVCVLVWVLPLFPARPLTAPIHNPTDHMMPPAFPLLLVVPAAVMDWLRMRFSSEQDTSDNRQMGVTTPGGERRCMLWLAVGSGLGFVATFVPVQWFFAEFLLSSLADNWFFAGGGRHWPFFLKIDEARVLFWGVEQDPLTWRAALLAMALAIASAWIGLRAGTWLCKLRR